MQHPPRSARQLFRPSSARTHGSAESAYTAVDRPTRVNHAHAHVTRDHHQSLLRVVVSLVGTSISLMGTSIVGNNTTSAALDTHVVSALYLSTAALEAGGNHLTIN